MFSIKFCQISFNSHKIGKSISSFDSVCFIKTSLKKYSNSIAIFFYCNYRKTATNFSTFRLPKLQTHIEKCTYKK